MRTEQTNFAVDVVARHLVTHPPNGGSCPDWEDYPEIGEHDWERVERRAVQIRDAVGVSDHVYEAAYEYLAGRADNDA